MVGKAECGRDGKWILQAEPTLLRPRQRVGPVSDDPFLGLCMDGMGRCS